MRVGVRAWASIRAFSAAASASRSATSWCAAAARGWAERRKVSAKGKALMALDQRCSSPG